MSLIDRFKTPSSIHTVTLHGDDFFIEPVSGNEADVANFQPLALEALENIYDEYTTEGHLVGGLYDDVFFHVITR